MAPLEPLPAEQLEAQALDRAHPLVLHGVPAATGAAAHRGVRVDEQQQAREGARGVDEELACLVSLGLGLANPNPNPKPNLRLDMEAASSALLRS